MEAVKEMVGYEGYARYQRSGIDWLADIPSSWSIRRLGMIGTFQKGGGISRNELVPEGLPAILYGDIYTKYNIVTNTCVNRISADTAAKAYPMKRGDLLLTGSGETKEDIGKCVLYDGEEQAYAGGDVIVYRTSGQHPLFLSYVLNSSGVIGEKVKISKGEIIVHIYGSKLKDISIPLPLLPEQTRIAAFLDNKCAQIDTAIAQKERLIALLKERRQVLVQQAVTKGLNPKAKMKDSGVAWLGEVPKHWAVKRLKSAVGLLTGNPFPSERYRDEGIPLVRGINVKEGVLNWEAKKCWPTITNDIERFRLFENDVLISMDGSKVGKNFSIVQGSDLPLLLNQRVARLRSKPELDAKYLFWNLACVNFLTWVSISKTDPMVPHIAPSDINDFVIGLPPVDEQQEISSYLDDAHRKHVHTLESCEAQITKLKEYRTVLINAAVTGKIKVPEA